MPVNETLSTYSDMSYATAVVIYVLAMLLYFAEFAYGPQRLQKEREREEARAGKFGQTAKVAAGVGTGGSARWPSGSAAWPSRSTCSACSCTSGR